MSMQSEGSLVGLVGQPLSGKDTVGAYLVERYDFSLVTMSDILRFYIAEHGLGEPTRDLLQQVGNQLRTEHGSSYLMELALNSEQPRLVISGLRNVGEAELLLGRGGYLLAVEAPLELRYSRARERGRILDEVTFEKFVEQQRAEENNSDPHAQQVLRVLEMATHRLSNEGTLEELHQKADQFVQTIGLR